MLPYDGRLLRAPVPQPTPADATEHPPAKVGGHSDLPRMGGEGRDESLELCLVSLEDVTEGSSPTSDSPS